MSIEDLDTKQELGRWLVEFLEGEPLPPGAVQGLQQAITPGAWQELVLLNGWANVGGVAPNAAYRTTPGGGIQLRGQISNAAAAGNQTMLNLPSTARPKNTLRFLVGCAEKISGLVDLNTEGNMVYIFGPAPTAEYVSLNGIVFWPGS